MIFGAKTRGRSAAALLLLAVVYCCWPSAPSLADTVLGNARAGWDLQQLMLDLRAVKIAKAKFVEQKYLRILSEPLESSGTLFYIAPYRLEKYTERPNPESLVVDRDKLTIVSDQGRRRRTLVLQDYPQIWAFVESIRATLAGDLPSLRRFYDVDLEGNAEAWQLLLRPSDPKTREMVRSIRIDGRRNSLHSIEIREADGDRSVMTVVPDGP